MVKAPWPFFCSVTSGSGDRQREESATVVVYTFFLDEKYRLSKFRAETNSKTIKNCRPVGRLLLGIVGGIVVSSLRAKGLWIRLFLKMIFQKRIHKRKLTEEGCKWKATKEYLKHRGTKIRVFRVCFRAHRLPPFFSQFFPPRLSPSGPVHSPTTSHLFTSLFISPFFSWKLLKGKNRG